MGSASLFIATSHEALLSDSSIASEGVQGGERGAVSQSFFRCFVFPLLWLWLWLQKKAIVYEHRQVGYSRGLYYISIYIKNEINISFIDYFHVSGSRVCAYIRVKRE